MAGKQVDMAALAQTLSMLASSAGGSPVLQPVTKRGGKKRKAVKTPSFRPGRGLSARLTRPPNKARRVSTASNATLREASGSDIDDSFSGGSFPCPVEGCDSQFTTLQESDAHAVLAHPEPTFSGLASSAPQKRSTAGSTTTKAPSESFPFDLGSLLKNKKLLAVLSGLTEDKHPSMVDSPPSIVTFPCSHCGKVCSTNELREEHVRRRHKRSIQLITCPMPGCHKLDLIDMNDLVAHLLSSHDGAPKPVAARQVATDPLPSDLVAAFSSLSVNKEQERTVRSLPSLSGTPQHSGPMDSQVTQFGQGLRSGQDRTTNPKARVHVVWPHEALDIVLTQRSFAYKDLSFPALMAGSLASIFNTSEFTSCPVNVQMFLQHLSLLAHAQVLSGNTGAVREFHRAVLLKVESGLLRWSPECTPTFDQMKLHFLAGLRPESVNVKPGKQQQQQQQGDPKKFDSGRAARIKEAQANCCKGYGNDNCSKPDGHDNLYHYCYYCFTVREDKDTHPQVSCKRGPPSSRRK